MASRCILLEKLKKKKSNLHWSIIENSAWCLSVVHKADMLKYVMVRRVNQTKTKGFWTRHWWDSPGICLAHLIAEEKCKIGRDSRKGGKIRFWLEKKITDLVSKGLRRWGQITQKKRQMSWEYQLLADNKQPGEGSLRNSYLPISTLQHESVQRI